MDCMFDSNDEHSIFHETCKAMQGGDLWSLVLCGSLPMCHGDVGDFYKFGYMGMWRDYAID